MPLDTWLGTTDSAYTTPANWQSGSAPVANDEIVLTGSQAIAGSDQSGTELDAIYIQAMAAQIGSEAAYLQLDTANGSDVVIDTTAALYLDLGTAAVSPVIRRTLRPQYPTMGLYLKGSALVDLHIDGPVSVFLAGVTLTGDLIITDPRAIVHADQDCTIPDWYNRGGGRVFDYGARTNIYNYGGEFNRYGSDDATLMDCFGGVIHDWGSGNTTNVRADGAPILGHNTGTWTNVQASGAGYVDPGGKTVSNNPTEIPYRIAPAPANG